MGVIGVAVGLIDRLRKHLRRREPPFPSLFANDLTIPAPTFVIPAKAGTHGGGAVWGLLPLVLSKAETHPLFSSAPPSPKKFFIPT